MQLQLLFALDELWIVTIKSVAGCLLSALLCFVLIPNYGLSGAAAAMIGGTALTLAIGALRLRRHGYVIGAPSILLGAYAVVALLVAPYFAAGNLLQSLAVKLVAAAAMIGGLWPFLSAEEESSIIQLARRRPKESAAR